MDKLLTRAGMALLALLLGWSGAALAASRYTDRVNALNLAEALDKGIYQNRLITSTFIQSVSKDQFLVKVILDNGAEQNWDMHQLRRWSREERLLLKDNRALLFPTEDDNRFVILDKTRFTRRALRAKVFTKRYKATDLLAGQEISFGIHRFNLAELVKVKPRMDEQGYRYDYILDLENGQREFLSMLDAYDALERDALTPDPQSVSPVLRAPYRVREIRPVALKEGETLGMQKFGVEIEFDRGVALRPGHFPFRFFENGNGKRTHRGEPPFLVEVTVPNSVVQGEVNQIETVEFLRNVHMLPDTRNEVRTLLRAAITPEVMNFPPEVTVNGNVVLVSFTKVLDQTVVSRREREANETRLRQSRLLRPTLSPEEEQAQQSFREAMAEGSRAEHEARRAEPFARKFDLLKEAMDAFQDAAANAGSDVDLTDALRERNAILVKLPVLVVQHVNSAIDRGEVSSRFELQQFLDEAALLTRDMELLNAIKALKEHPELR